MELRELQSVADQEQHKLYNLIRPELKGPIHLRPDVDFQSNGVKVCERRFDIEISPNKTVSAYVIVYETLSGDIEKEFKVSCRDEHRKEISFRMTESENLPAKLLLCAIKESEW